MHTCILGGSLLGGAMDSGGNLEEPISRVVVKKMSARTYHEAKRKEDMELRRKRLIDIHTNSWCYMYNPCMFPYGRILDRMENNPMGGAAFTYSAAKATADR